MNDKGSYQPLTYFQLMEVSLRELLVEKGVLTQAQVEEAVEDMRNRTPERGARVVARAWVDAEFKKRLLADGPGACESLGIDVPKLRLVVVENTPQVHNAIVYTLCSCYPRMLLGIPPDWYKSRNYRSRMLREPRAFLSEFGFSIPNEVNIRVNDSTADMRYM
jgi:nitrile hydratase